MERRPLPLRHLSRLAEHLTRPRKVDLATRLRLADRRQHVVRPVDVGVHRREAVGEALSDKALSGQVVALVEIVLAEDLENAGVALQSPRMQRELRDQMRDARQPMAGVLQSDSPHQPVNLVPPLQQQLGEVASVLTGNPGDKRLFGHKQDRASQIVAQSSRRNRTPRTAMSSFDGAR